MVFYGRWLLQCELCVACDMDYSLLSTVLLHAE